ncbi:hypothetical protein [Streptococcus equi]|uniref:hypothetical protein n=1 Tax=Streptococcus equi TaxID=1336 RepID=UPI000DA316A3|nr:hypothetical protein [Streptococcus equi]MCD3391241.1 hypothetical protein [Streptococcus equi subsp. zooepidemicus]MCD3460756.1 hypothetical protein [Streptococcus equi subsp. zooepidemicus]SQF05811.1 Uncharacterised protein [Streptococcus equi subsp. zooepidemicus]HEK9980132.1 hypothetical protein [Streptococcus equi subsp. zooepidemicus]HEL0620307.1 hypothetical protein [Streptococcus equi subsp. zooepidemicus]
MDNCEFSEILLLAVIFGIAWSIDFLISLSKKKDKKSKQIYIDEEIALAEFLEKKQSINELYLQTHKELLRHLRR